MYSRNLNGRPRFRAVAGTVAGAAAVAAAVAATVVVAVAAVRAVAVVVTAAITAAVVVAVAVAVAIAVLLGARAWRNRSLYTTEIQLFKSSSNSMSSMSTNSSSTSCKFTGSVEISAMTFVAAFAEEATVEVGT